MFNFCNTANRISVSIPGGNYMNVALKSSSDFGGFDCEESVDAARSFLLSDLIPEIKSATGLDDVRVRPVCLYSLGH
jgi:hypothetical protein